MIIIGERINILHIIVMCCIASCSSPRSLDTEQPSPDDIQLARKYAPIYIFHQQEPILPISVESLQDKVHLVFRDKGDTLHIHDGPIGNMSSLGELSFWEKIRNDLEKRCNKLSTKDNESERVLNARKEVDKAIAIIKENAYQKKVNISLDLDVINLWEYKYDNDQEMVRRTPVELADSISRLLHGRPKCYVHVERNIRISWPKYNYNSVKQYNDNAELNRKLAGRYDIIYYVLYYPFNLYTNVHEGDWDSSIAVVVPVDKKSKPSFVIYYSHHGSMMFQLTSDSEHEESFHTYLGKYDKWLTKRESSALIGPCYALNEYHPLVFIAHGSHAAYPIPGFTMTGADVNLLVKKIKFPYGIDTHALGNKCFPVFYEGGNDSLLKHLDDAFMDPSFSVVHESISNAADDNFEFLVSKKWAKYPGLWGEHSELIGWAGVGGFLYSKNIITKHEPNRLRSSIEAAKHPLDDISRIQHLPSTADLKIYPCDMRKKVFPLYKEEQDD